jgi:hypothetical protein
LPGLSWCSFGYSGRMDLQLMSVGLSWRMSAENLSLDYLYCFHQVESLTWHIFSLFTYRLDMVGIQQTFLPVISWTVPHDDQSGDRSLFPLLQVKVLRSMRVLSAEDVVVGQYKSHTRGGVKHPGYTEDKDGAQSQPHPNLCCSSSLHWQCSLGWCSFPHEGWQSTAYQEVSTLPIAKLDDLIKKLDLNIPWIQNSARNLPCVASLRWNYFKWLSQLCQVKSFAFLGWFCNWKLLIYCTGKGLDLGPMLLFHHSGS